MILIIDDDSAILLSLRTLLRREAYDVATASGPDEALEKARSQSFSLILMDMNFSRATSGQEGLELLRKMQIFQPGVPIILMTAWGSIDLAVEGMRAGAFDFITKPWDTRKLIDRIATAMHMTAPEAAPQGEFDRAGIIGNDPALTDALKLVRRIAPTDAPVLITGESGTGKELIAEAIHRNSLRAGKPFIKVNLGGVPQTLFESEMFGYRKGAFTGAVADRIGRFEAADGGTIFLDEIGEMDTASQVKMLRVLQEQAFEPLGSSTTKHVDVRVICATNADLPAMVADRTFREDLYYRINLVEVKVPPLRRRPGDIAALAKAFAQRISPDVSITDEALAYLKSLPFPGNIRELRNLVERTVLVSGSNSLQTNDFRACVQPTAINTSDSTLEEIERSRVAQALTDAGGNVSRAAAALGISRAALYRRMEKFGIS